MKYNTKINDATAQTHSSNNGTHHTHFTHFTHFVTFPKAAFTLAEVLITLAIIGVVAAITIPSVVQKYQERVTVTKLKKVYSTLNQAYQMAVIENGTIDQWGLTLSEKDEESGWYTEETMQSFYKFWNVMLKYMKSAKICTYEDDCNLKNFTIKSLDGTEWNAKSRVISILLDDGTMLTGGDINNADCNSDFKTSLTKDVCGDLKFFLNANKSEYTVGKDAFIFLFYKLPGDKLSKEKYCNSPYLGEGTGFVPYFFYTSDKKDYWDTEKNCRQIVYPENDEELTDTLLNDQLYGCGKSETNAYCTKIIQLNGWKIPDDYPIKF